MGLTLAAVAALIAILIAIRPPPPPPATPPVGSVLYLWYGSPQSSGLGTPGWNSTSDPGGGSVVDTPVIGFYSSDSNQTFAWQIAQMRGAGLSFAVVSWWGPYTSGERGAINNATKDLFRYLSSTNYSFKLAVMIDAYNGSYNLSRSALQADYQYIYTNFVLQYKNLYLDWSGKPLLLLFNPVYPTVKSGDFSIRTIGNYPNKVNWTFWTAPSEYLVSQSGPHVNATNDEGNPVVSSDGEVTIVPRIDSYYQVSFGYADSYLRFDPGLNLGLYSEQWNYVISNKAQVSLVLIYSWNEYHERTTIEPHVEATATVSATYLANLTSSYIDRL